MTVVIMLQFDVVFVYSKMETRGARRQAAELFPLRLFDHILSFLSTI
jgi:hypothetical protein